jgi:uncharacterized secreted protein with C-terminal beta-propeller domain
MRRRAVVAGVVVVALSAACSSRVAAPQAVPSPTPSASASPAPSPRPTVTPTKKPQVHANAAVGPRLLRYVSCNDLLGSIKREALKEVTPYGLAFGGGMGGPIAFDRAAAPMPAAAPMAAAGTSTGGSTGGGAPAASTTNNQEAGVDEPDLAKTDGTRMVVVRHQPLGVQVVDVRTATPRLRGFLGLGRLAYDAQLLLADRYVVAIGTSATTDGRSSQTVVVVIDVDDLDHPKVVRTYTVDGTVVSSRYTAGRVVLVLQDTPRIEMTSPQDGSQRALSQSLKENRRRIAESRLDRWLPHVVSHPSGTKSQSRCDATYHSSSESGVGTTSVLTLDPEKDLHGRMVSVVGNAGVVYASTTSLYVAMTSWQAQWAMSRGAPSAERTQVHGFDISQGIPDYLGSGSVPGTLVGQYALSEHEGYLRVASTEGETVPPPSEGVAPVRPSDNLVTVLHPEDGALAKVGQVRGLGLGERIYGVRFLGDLGYVVTFRQTDPLYVVDLRDPARPRVRGELKVTGYSSYLHPIGDDKLVGLGQAVDTQLRQQGTQVSVFDVSDPAAPSLDSRLRFSSSHSAAEGDPHAFLWWGPARLVVVPLERYDGNEPFNGVAVMRVSAGGLVRDVGRVEHPVTDGGNPQPDDRGAPMPMPCCPGITRSLVVGDLLFTVSESGVMASTLEDLRERAWMPFR